MGVDQVSLHDHSSDTEGGEEIAPVSLEPGSVSLEDTEQFTFGDNDDAALEYDPNAGSSGAFVQSGSPMRVTGGTLTATGTPAISAEGNVDVATGSAIRDGSGTDRFEVESTITRINDEGGNRGLEINQNSATTLFGRSGHSVNIYDEQGAYTAVKYETDPDAGVLRTPGAGARIESDGSPSSGDGAEILWDDAGSKAVFQAYDRSASSYRQVQVSGEPLELKGQGGLVDMSGPPANLRLATGQSIEDGSGQARFELLSGRTRIRDDEGNLKFDLIGSNKARIYAHATNPVSIWDSEGNYDAVQYDTDSDAGVLRTPGAGLVVEGGVDGISARGSGTGVEIYHDVVNEQGHINAYDRSASSYKVLKFGGDAYHFTANPGNLRLATDQSIEDGSGVSRLYLGGVRTRLIDNAGNIGISLRDNNYNRLHSLDGQPLRIYDEQGSFDAVQYTTSGTAPGTLELTNATLTHPGNHTPAIDLKNPGSSSNPMIEIEKNWNNGAWDDAAIRIRNPNQAIAERRAGLAFELTTDDGSPLGTGIWGEKTGSSSAEIIVRDESGNQTTLT